MRWTVSRRYIIRFDREVDIHVEVGERHVQADASGICSTPSPMIVSAVQSSPLRANMMAPAWVCCRTT